MQEDPKPTSIPEPHESLEEKLRQSLSAFNQEQEERKSRRDRSRWTYREGVYMVVFHALVIFMLGGLHGANQIPSRHRTGSALIDAEGNFSFSLQSFFAGAGDFVRGYPIHFRDSWWVDLILILSMTGLAFFIKDTKVRRRCFTMMTVIVICVMGYAIATSMPAISRMP